jgi:tyrosyl-DNA phosphodiesterase 1
MIRTKLVTLGWKGDEEKEQPTEEIVRLPVPYQLPPEPYRPEGLSLFSPLNKWCVLF